MIEGRGAPNFGSQSFEVLIIKLYHYEKNSIFYFDFFFNLD